MRHWQDESAPAGAAAPFVDEVGWAGRHLKLLELVGPPSVVVDGDHEIRHLSNSVGRFLRVDGGVPSSNLLRLVKPELSEEIRSLLGSAAQTGEPARALHLPLIMEGRDAHVTIEVWPVSLEDDRLPLFLVMFRLQSKNEATETVEWPPKRDESSLSRLEREIARLKNELHATIEQFRESTEELKASNEELQAANEELRSTTEELETGREELQSMNEELSAVNLESKSKVEELAQTNSDLQNLMSATAIATIFLDRELNVMRFTESAAPLFHLISTDIGRPLWHMRSQISYGNLAADAEQVLHTLSPLEREVQGAGDACYLARMLPYRTVEDRIAGVVLTFIDITERQRAAVALLAQNEQLQRFNQATIGRELRMIELKLEINKLLERLGEGPRYSVESAEVSVGT